MHRYFSLLYKQLRDEAPQERTGCLQYSGHGKETYRKGDGVGVRDFICVYGLRRPCARGGVSQAGGDVSGKADRAHREYSVLCLGLGLLADGGAFWSGLSFDAVL